MGTLPFTRLTLPDQQTNAAVQDIYNKLQQSQLALSQLSQSLNKQIAGLQSQVSQLTGSSASTWSGLTLATGWNNFDTIHFSASWIKIGVFAYLSGMVRNTLFSSGGSILTLDRSIWPANNVEIWVDVVGAANIGQLRITPTGGVVLVGNFGGGSNITVSLDGTLFRVQ